MENTELRVSDRVLILLASDLWDAYQAAAAVAAAAAAATPSCASSWFQYLKEQHKLCSTQSQTYLPRGQ